jgi:hypothetical protein
MESSERRSQHRESRSQRAEGRLASASNTRVMRCVMKAPFRARIAEELRKQAKESRAAAETAVDPKVRAMLLRVAERYDALADEQDLANQQTLPAGPKATRGGPM